MTNTIKSIEDMLITELPNAVSGFLKGNTTDLVGAPVDIINEILGAVSGGALRSERPIGGSKHLRALVFGEQGVEDKSPIETLAGFISPQGAAMAGKAMVVGAFKVLKDQGASGPEAIKLIQKAQAAHISGNPQQKAEALKSTGVYIGPEGKARAVISDAGAKLKPGAVDEIVDSRGKLVYVVNDFPYARTLDKFVDHPQLFRLYPELKEYKVETNLTIKGSAQVNTNTKVISIAPATSPDEIKRILLHEIQHGVQRAAGFTGGGTPEMFRKYPISEETVQRLVTVTKESAKYSPETVNAAREFLIKINKDKYNAFQEYKNLPGETEARFTEETANMSKALIEDRIYKLLSNDIPYHLWAK